MADEQDNAALSDLKVLWPFASFRGYTILFDIFWLFS